MCQRCGCTEYIRQGKPAVLKRAVEIIRELGVTPANTEDYEEIESISRFIAPFGAVDDEVYETAAWMSSLHMDMSRLKRYESYQAHARAFRDVFSRLPAKGSPKHIATAYHQLEQLSRELSETDLAATGPETRETVRAVNRVHDGLAAREEKLKQRYGL